MDDLDRILISDETVVPSSGFVDGVMEAIDAAVHEPPPFPFPWRRFAAGLLVCAVWAALCVWVLKRFDTSEIAAALDEAWTPLWYAAWTVGGCFAALFLLRARTSARLR